MSNLIKYNYINLTGNNKKVIDSNAITKKLFSERTINKNEEAPNAEFIEGIAGVPIDKILVDREELEQEEAESIIDEAREKAEEIIEEANNTAESIKAEALEEAKMLKQSAYDEGYNKGVDEINKLKKDLELQIRRNSEEYKKELEDLEPKVVEVMAELIENITGIVVEDKKDVMIHLINKAIMNTESNRFVIKVSKEDYDFLQENKGKIHKALSPKVQVEITEDIKLIKNQCMIETDSCVIDSSLDVQLNNLITDLRIMSANA